MGAFYEDLVRGRGGLVSVAVEEFVQVLLDGRGGKVAGAGGIEAVREVVLVNVLFYWFIVLCTNSSSSRSIGSYDVPIFLDDFGLEGFVRSATVVLVFFVTFEMVVESPAPLLALRFLIGIMQKTSVRMPRMMIAVRSVMLAVALECASNLTRTDGVVVQQRS